MKKNSIVFLIVFALNVMGGQVMIEYFYQVGCDECEKVDAFVLPRLSEEYSGKYQLRRYDIGVPENYIKLVELQEKLRIDTNDPVCMILDRRIYLGGFPAIENQLFSLLASMPDTAPPESEQTEADALERRAESFTVGAILVAGLVDGINPCVFATLVFFLSLLAVSKISGRKLLLVGSIYCLACFLSYLALGFGLFRFLKLLSGFRYVQSGIEYFLILLLLVFAFLSFRDAWRFRRTGRPEQVTLQLPEKIKMRIHSTMRRGLKYRFLLPGAFMIGVIVTVFESICTGQVYVPTLVLMSKDFGLGSRWFGFLLLYNLMFILPLLVLFLAAWKGTTTPILLRWSKMNVIGGKIALGSFFIGMALLMIWLNNPGGIR